MWDWTITLPLTIGVLLIALFAMWIESYKDLEDEENILYKVRFHLQYGEHFMHWQVKNIKTGETLYFNPEECSLVMKDCVLRNHPNQAQKILDGGHKTVVAWIECKQVEVINSVDNIPPVCTKINYNPRKNVHWNYKFGKTDIVADGEQFEELVTIDRSVYF